MTKVSIRPFHPVRLPLLAWLLLAVGWAGCATTPADVRQMAAPGGDAAVDRIAPYLNSKNAAVRQAALEALLKMPDSYPAWEVLMNATFSPEPDVRGDAGAALLFHPHPDLDFYAITLIADPDPAVRRRLAEGLTAAGRAGPLEHTRDAGVFLWGLEQDPDPTVRAVAAQGLGELGLNDPIDFALTALRTDSDPRVRAAAAYGLGVPARAYLSGARGPEGEDPQVKTFLAQSGLPVPDRTPTQARGEDIVAALCVAARKDAGEYQEIIYTDHLLGRGRSVETRTVAQVAAQALTVPGKPPRADVAAAQAAAAARARALPPPESSAARAWQLSLSHGPAQR